MTLYFLLYAFLCFLKFSIMSLSSFMVEGKHLVSFFFF